ncbi:MAG: hypothetical protein UW69_C0089G0009 [Microgenomates group bacterium GW2011_GWA2_44_7]|nr:MAG: hypothetical protein UW69_C0089G0009 [Microgenomates group bacterium GW2011_GWA2_44_7]
MQTYIPRLAEKNLHDGLKSGKIIILLGARQVGKTTLLKHTLKGESTLFLNLDTQVDREKLLKAAAITPSEAIRNLGSPETIVIDEAQRLPEVSRIVKGWFDYEVSSRIILSGSSSLDLLDQSAESLTGRNVKIHLPPLLFEEMVRTQNWFPLFEAARQTDTHAFSDQFSPHLLSAMVYGGYPDVFTNDDKPSKLTSLVTDYLLKDILQISLVKNPELIQKLLTLLAYQTGSIISTNELANNLLTSRATIEKYLDLLEKIYVVFRLPAFSSNPRKEITKGHKMYFWDTGIRNALIGEFSLNQSEVDLVIKEITGELKAFEIKWSPGKTTKAFTPKYHIPVNLIHRENFINYLLKTPNSAGIP